MTPSFPFWLHALSILSLVLGMLCALVIVFDETRRPQTMWIMNAVWPLTALYAGVFGLVFYWRWSRSKSDHATAGAEQAPWSVSVAKATTHCGAGCTLGDIIAEWTAFLIPAIAVAFGWKTLFTEKMFAIWVLDFVLAFLIGILFQYFTIQPMRHLSVRAGLVAALKADGASITAWQIGMYGAMAAIQFLWFRAAYGAMAPTDCPEFWFAMQLAMLCGFATSFPANAALMHFGLKEPM
ncbi:MAG TPA: DUF4396 domain-containing protein [Methylovirgula sp.]